MTSKNLLSTAASKAGRRASREAANPDKGPSGDEWPDLTTDETFFSHSWFFRAPKGRSSSSIRVIAQSVNFLFFARKEELTAIIG